MRYAAAILAALFCLTATATADTDLPAEYSDEQLVEILKADGFRAVEIDEPDVLQVKIDGLIFYVFVQDDNDLLLYFGLTGYNVNVSDMNEWNATRRLTRAYLDSDNDPILEADVFAGAGYSAAQFSETITIFNTLAREFQGFLNERNVEEEDRPAAGSISGP